MTKMKNINISLTNNSYDIHIGKDLSNEVPKLIAPFMNRRKIFIVCDENIGSIILPKIKQPVFDINSSNTKLKIFNCPIAFSDHTPGYNVDIAALAFGVNLLEKTISELLNNGIERNDTLIAVGGGVIGDLSGFISSIIYRGINFVQIPTTLLAQVDSSVGGKTAINVVQGKNLVGSFYQPKTVITDIDFLSSLTKREIKCGLSEIIKYGIICDKDFFYWLDENAKDLLMLNEECLIYAIKKSCLMKAHIVQKDERETGERALLNFGHTFGHALEKHFSETDYLLHGEAVSIGMAFAAKFSLNKGFLPKKEYKNIISLLSKLGLPISLNEIQGEITKSEILDLMVYDKKRMNSSNTLILINEIGKAFINKDISNEEIECFFDKENIK